MFEDASVKVVFLLREPECAIQSMNAAFSTWWGQHQEDSREVKDSAIRYFRGRLKKLRSYAGKSDPDRTAFITYEQLLNRTDEVFRLLESVIGLKGELSEGYEVKRTTGVSGLGDESRKIHAGRIIRDERNGSPLDGEIEVESGLQDEYWRTCETLSRCAQTIAGRMTFTASAQREGQ